MERIGLSMEIIPSMKEFVNNFPLKPYCGKMAVLDKKKGEDFVFFCGQASCSRKYCRKLFYFKRIYLTSDLIKEYDLDRFFTLTMKRNISKKEAWKNVPYIWDKTAKRLRRLFNGLLYCAILEAHKDGYPHIHGFINKYIHQREWSRIFQACGGGSYVWVEKIKVSDGKIAEYVTKQLNVARYIGKEQVLTARQFLEPRARSFWRTQGMKTKFELSKKKNSDFIIVPGYLYKETEKGFDKLFRIEYSSLAGHFVLVHNKIYKE